MTHCTKCSKPITDGQSFKFHPDHLQGADTSCAHIDDAYHHQCAPKKCSACQTNWNEDTYYSGSAQPGKED